MARPTGRDIRSEVMNEARRAMQSAGVGGFSYRDLAERVGVKAPSIHHHFPHRSELVAATTRRYRTEFATRVEAIAAGPATERLRAYADLFLHPAADGVMCLCGAAAAGWDALDDAAKAEVDAFFVDQRRWLVAEIERGVAGGELRADLDPDDLALTLLSALEGALVLARTPGAQRAPAAVVGLLGLARA
ncbi:MAG: TetR/AcrR family transcriptional regulator [Actinomycetota bacterium]